MWYEIIYPFPNFNGLVNNNNSDSDNGMAPNKRQPIIWTNDDQV